MELLDRFMLQRDDCALLIIDIQEKLCRAMDPSALGGVLRNTEIMLNTALELGLPVLTTEQYPDGLGLTLAELRDRLPEPAMTKLSFSCCGDQAVLDRIESLGRRQIVVTGMESHVCVLQTVLDLLHRGFVVHVLADAVISRTAENRKLGLKLAAAAGAVVSSTETALFQLLRLAGTEEFKKLSKLVR